MNYENLIKNAYKYYDEKSELYDHIIKGTVRYEEDTSDNDLTKRVIRFYDDKNNTKLEANYEYMGFKTDEGPTRKGLWIWGWAKEESSKNMTYISKNILKYGLDIVLNESVLNNKVEHKENSNKFLKSLLISFSPSLCDVSGFQLYSSRIRSLLPTTRIYLFSMIFFAPKQSNDES